MPGQRKKPFSTWYVLLHLLRPSYLSPPDPSTSSNPPAPHFMIPRRRLTDPQLDRVREGQFYILVPDNETRREVDALRVMWAAGDVAEGRPALSRWHKDYKAIFDEYVRDGLAQLD